MKGPLLFICFLHFAFAGFSQKPIAAQKLSQKLTSQPSFPGDNSAMNVFLHKNIQYPQMERDNDIQGKVVLRFMIDTIGAIEDIQVVRKVSPGIDKEAVRVVKLMPQWKPAMYKNKPVPVYYVLPVKFYLTKDGKPEN